VIILFFNSCTHTDTATHKLTTVTGNKTDSIHSDTLIKNDYAVVVERQNEGTGETEDVVFWAKFPVALAFENFKSATTSEKKHWTGKLNYDALKLDEQPEEIRKEIIDSLNKKNIQMPAANFNGHYKIITTEIGNDCCFHFLVDLTSGTVNKIESSLWGAEFRSDSYLLILNPPKDIYKYYQYDLKTYMIGQNFYPAISNFRGPEGYLFINNEFKRVY
jgi:hypothetical protein